MVFRELEISTSSANFSTCYLKIEMYWCQVIKNIVMDKVTMIKELYTAVGFKLFLAHFGLNSDWLKIFHLIKWQRKGVILGKLTLFREINLCNLQENIQVLA